VQYAVKHEIHIPIVAEKSDPLTEYELKEDFQASDVPSEMSIVEQSLLPKSLGLDPSVPKEERVRRYREAIGRWPHVVFAVDKYGTLLDVSDEITDRFGYIPDQIVGQSAFDFVHPDDHHLVALELTAELEDPSRNSERIHAQIRHADGSYRMIELLGINRIDDAQLNALIVAIRDVTGRRVSERVMAAGDYLFTSTSTVASDGTTIFDANGQRVYSSPSLERILGYTTEELLTIKPQGLVHPDDVAIWKHGTRKALETDNGSSRVECRLLRKDGSTVWIEATVVNLLNQPAVRGVVVHTRDIDDRHRFEEELKRRASEDPLTALGNRAALLERLEATGKVERPLTVLFCDLDGFKRVNDRFGHQAGDALLRDVGMKIRAVIGASDFAARIGGDEFCVVSQVRSTVSEAHQLAEQIRDAVALVTAPDNTAIGVSIGVLWTTSAEAPSDILSQADHAMYEAKRQGSNRIELCRT
jgi:diguanylate cyclase (GGDEF)-like protein/PAS domain S-box-containing protein